MHYPVKLHSETNHSHSQKIPFVGSPFHLFTEGYRLFFNTNKEKY